MSKIFSVNLKNIVFLNTFKRLSLILIFGVSVIVNAAPGELDTSFGGTGKIRRGFGGKEDKASATATQPDGKLVVVGTSLNLD